jgi:heme iron utilization protein
VTPEDQSSLEKLLVGERLIALGLVVDGEPVSGLLPYALAEDHSALYVQASRLARHSQGLREGARWSGTIHEPDSPQADPLQVARLTLEGTVAPLAAGSPERDAAARALLARFPGAAMTLPLPDFSIHRLGLEGGRMVLGFGRAINLSKHHFADLDKRLKRSV